MSEALPEFTVRVSDRARHIRLTVSARDGLVVVVPRRWRGDASAIVAAKRDWADRALSRVAERRAVHAAGPSAMLPDRIELRAACRLLSVQYAPAGTGPARAMERGDVLTVSGDPDPGARIAALSRWLDRAAREILPPRLAVLSAHCGLMPGRVRVGRARSRWGSCSARGTVSLARNLVFLEPELVDALILHELAHLKVMDHSARFWELLRTLDPGASAHRTRMRDAARMVPPWAEA